MENKIKVDLGFATLVAERNADPNYKEVFIYLEDENGRCIQDIASAGENYHYDDETGDKITEGDCLIVHVWGDELDEDYTNTFNIKKYNEEEE